MFFFESSIFDFSCLFIVDDAVNAFLTDAFNFPGDGSNFVLCAFGLYLTPVYFD